MKTTFLFKTILLLVVRGLCEVNATVCQKLLDTCTEDCDCCDYRTNPSIRCEMRTKSLGHRCYIGKNNGEECQHNSDCKSQWCTDGICFRHFSNPPGAGFCLLNQTVTAIIDGSIPLTSNSNCPCQNPPRTSLSDAQDMMAVEPKSDTLSNNHALGSGFEFRSIISGPLRSIHICSGDGFYMRDPTSFKLEGDCHGADFRLITEGRISFPNRKAQIQKGTDPSVKECITISVKSQSFCHGYRITFPTQRGGDAPCNNVDTCQNYPTEISELSLHGPCSQVVLTPSLK